ncbi:hypothetical protein BDY17DRAFT_292459 [Neohortaea acidophila]|uniref:Enoyl reductase (ER) domain-containing protein n=1 Tax=Neohortaea acidophila TaxID=245834 RepID=A0A6A6PZH3_9PEZI|nr:uncharacterized protein BDY17DRAFT_292459 [Neohortaea acidophila]KAF2484833.1 hypothetical protein BDY17DRAFT_292459 [Neohortaea acidophila]
MVVLEHEGYVARVESDTATSAHRFDSWKRHSACLYKFIGERITPRLHEQHHSLNMATQEAKAWVYTGGYNTLKRGTIHPPSASAFKDEGDGPPHMLVKIHACALNPVDVQIMNLPSWKQPWNALYGKEKGTVNDYSGTVIAPGRTGFKEGDEVFGLTLKPYAPNGGALAEVADLNTETSLAALKPKGWSHEKASAISLVWLTAKASIDSVAPFVEASQNKKVAVLGGSSSTGLYTIILAKRKGWKVVATSSGKNKDFVLSTLGADEHVDYTSQDVREGVAKFQPDAVIDCVGGTECIGLPSSKRYISIVGDKVGRESMGGPYTYYDYWHPIRAGLQWFRWAKGQYGLGESYDVTVLSKKKEWLEDAKNTLGPDDIYIDSVHEFDKANEAFERLNTGRAKGKVVVKVSSKL